MVLLMMLRSSKPCYLNATGFSLVNFMCFTKVGGLDIGDIQFLFNFASRFGKWRTSSLLLSEEITISRFSELIYLTCSSVVYFE